MPSARLGSAIIRILVEQAMSTPAPVDPRFAELYNRAAEALATAEIFQQRAKKYRRLVMLLTFFGVAIPGTIGVVALGNLVVAGLLENFKWYAGVLLAIQFIFSIWSIVANWPDSLDYSLSAGANNHRLANQLKALAAQAAGAPADFDVRYTALVAADEAQNLLDNTKGISESEKVYGHRAALLQFERKCKICQLEPVSMKMPFWSRNRCPRCGGEKKK
jgi:mobilome CxxCx(11)CxxC protein